MFLQNKKLVTSTIVFVSIDLQICREKKQAIVTKEEKIVTSSTTVSTPSQPNFWQTMEDARKEIEETQWKKTDTSQAPVEEMKMTKMEVKEESMEVARGGNSNGILSIGGNKYVDQSTLFYQFWNQAKWKQTPLYEFELDKK